MHGQAVKDVRNFKDSTGNCLWRPSVKEGEPDRILGRPIYTSVYMPTIAAGAKTVLFGDFAYYWIGATCSQLKRLCA
jgi:HK97 family phage major capsid protein